MLRTFLNLILTFARAVKVFVNSPGKKGASHENSSFWFAGLTGCWLGSRRYVCASSIAHWFRFDRSSHHHRYGCCGWLWCIRDGRRARLVDWLRSGEKIHQKGCQVILVVLAVLLPGQHLFAAIPGTRACAISSCEGEPFSFEVYNEGPNGILYCHYGDATHLITQEYECQGPKVCNPMSAYAIKYMKFGVVLEDPRHTLSVGQSKAVSDQWSATYRFGNLCIDGCLQSFNDTGLPHTDTGAGNEYGSVWYKTAQTASPWDLYTPVELSQGAATCDASTTDLSGAEFVDRNALSGSSAGGTSTLPTFGKIDESGTPTGSGAYEGSPKAQSILDGMQAWLSSASFVPTLPWRISLDLPSGSCTNPQITWLGKTSEWGVCGHSYTDTARMLWAYLCAMWAAFNIWGMALRANE